MFAAIKTGCFVVFCLILTACASNSSQLKPIVPLSAQQRQLQLEQLQEFKLTGALGVKAPEESVSGSLNWQQQGPYFQANMTNFVGISIFELETDARGATVKADGETHQAQSASALLDYLSGWSLPIEEMPLWLKGVASAESFNHQWDAQGRLTSFTLKDSQERDWQVSYKEFFPDALALPRHIQLNSKADGSRIKLVVRKWQL
ncbi:MAG: lipoprotein insertase outer membrane protein LolB [Gammaproteobacteria bacterium]|nr:lipoprotein insertase outer membrane protein LolB [Gammaproteobacteria bacterium]MBU2058182.1 lipoprotein insertase outer membrane protein LolB [Gammaproteobacteria bacterium]MBU2176917.1 lipoprotein insertase outer membrane protein LolB [Gammaproteobacteria bacterium]MBU2246042.1 lipoprotein insertase outer membrane protein LolB [Gammaproteobacteria bacterium]MBU2344113.1 lipoprotein insertase outer membrane protein LolB [Gammaproteobacteria bacterium]